MQGIELAVQTNNDTRESVGAKFPQEHLVVRGIFIGVPCVSYPVRVSGGIRNIAPFVSPSETNKGRALNSAVQTNKELEFVPKAYQTPKAIAYMLKVIKSGQADTLEEAIRLYDLEECLEK